MSAVSNKPKCPLSNYFTELVPWINSFHKLKLLKIVNMKCSFFDQRVLLRRLSPQIFANIYFSIIIFFYQWRLRHQSSITILTFGHFFNWVFTDLSGAKHSSILSRGLFFFLKLIVNVMKLWSPIGRENLNWILARSLGSLGALSRHIVIIYICGPHGAIFLVRCVI